MNGKQRLQLRKKFRKEFQSMYSLLEVPFKVDEINAWMYENSFEEQVRSIYSMWGYHLLTSDSEFIKERTI